MAPAPSPPEPPGTLTNDGGAVAFTADGVAVPVAALEALIERVPREQARRLREDGGTTDFVEHVALTQALYRRALDAGLHEDPAVRQALAMAHRELLASEFLRSEASRTVTPAYVSRRYAEMPELRIQQLHLRHLRLGDGADVDRLRSDIAARGFAEVARVASLDEGTRGSGGDLGWLDRAVVEGAFGPAVADAPAGELLGPVTGAGATHLVQVEARRDAIPLEEIEEGLTAELLREEMARLTDEVRAELVVDRP